jgi:hypothetical protein
MFIPDLRSGSGSRGHKKAPDAGSGCATLVKTLPERADLQPSKLKSGLTTEIAGEDCGLRGGEARGIQLVDLLAGLQHHGGVASGQDQVGVLLLTATLPAH